MLNPCGAQLARFEETQHHQEPKPFFDINAILVPCERSVLVKAFQTAKKMH